jgi:hypothetical protein
MNAENIIVDAFVGEFVFAAMAVGALLAVAALLKIMPTRTSDGTDRPDEQNESVMVGLQTSAERQPDEAVAYPACT